MAPVDDAIREIAVGAPRPSESFDLASSSNSNLNNGDPTGVAGWDDELWVINNDTDRRFRYERSDGSSGTVNSLPDSANSNPTGMWAEDSTMWVADWDDTRLYAYSIAANGSLSDRSSSSDIDLTGANDGPRGVSGHGGTVWVVDIHDTYVYAYNTSTRQRDSAKEFNLKGGNSDPWGIWTDGSVAWVNDRDDLIIRAYDLTASGEPLLTDRRIDLRPSNSDPRGMWSDGETLWVADSGDDYVYAYELDDSRKPSEDIDLTSANDHPIRIAGDGETIWVADSNDTYVYAYHLSNGNRRSNREFNMTHSGHRKVDGMWVHDDLVWTLDDQDKTLYTYNKSSGATTDDGFTVGLGVGVPLEGMWGNSSSIWLVTRLSSLLYAFSHSGNSQGGRFVNLDKALAIVEGMWSDGTVVWILDSGNSDDSAGLFAHRLSNGDRLSALDIRLSPLNADPVGVYGHGETIWVGDSNDTKLYAYEKPSYTDPSFPGGDATTRTVDENVSADASVGAPVSADDPDGDTLTYSMTGTDADSFTIESATGQIRVKQGTSLDAETRQSYEVVVHVTDKRNNERESDTSIDDSITVTINVNNLDEPGTVQLSSTEPESGAAVTASLTDVDGSVSDVSWQWLRRRGRSGSFAAITGATGASYTPVDGDEGYFLRARASYTDPQGPNKSATATTTRAVVIPNADPTFDAGSATTRSVDENAAAGTAVGSPVNATDPDSDTLTYSLTGDDAAAFTIDGTTGQIRVGSGTTLNFESRDSYSVTARVSDGKDEISQADDVIDDTIEVTINIRNVDEPGVVTLSTGAPQQGEAMDATLTDPDGSVTGSSWQWWRGLSGSGPWTSVSGATGSGYTPAADDVDGYLRVTVSYSDAEGSGKSAEAVTEQTVVGPTIVNDPPTFDEGTTAARSIDENVPAGTNVGAPVRASDIDSDPLSYSLAGTTLFTVAGSTGQIRVAAGATVDFESESSHSFTLRVTDNRSPTGEPSSAIDDFITVTVTLNNLDDPGTVSFNTDAPEVDSAVEAALSDPDGARPGVSWQWSRRRGASGTFGDISGATNPSYTPTLSDVGYFLRATASYTDDEGPNKSTSGIVPQAVTPNGPLSDQRSAIAVQVIPARPSENGGTDHRAILAAQFLAIATPVENAPEGCRAVAGYSSVDDNATPGIADDVALIELDVIEIVRISGAACRYDVTLDLPAGYALPRGSTTYKNVLPGTTVDVRLAVAGRNVLLLQNVVGDSGGGTARYELSTNCGPGVLPPALLPMTPSGGVVAGESFVAVELRQGRYNISPAISPDPGSPRAWAGVPVPALNEEGEACEASVAISDLPARCVAERAAIRAALPTAAAATILEFKLMCGDDIEAERAAVIGDDGELDSPVRVEVITPTIAGTYKVAWATWDDCDPGAGTSGMSGSVTLTVAGSAGPDSPRSPGEHTGTAESIPVMINPDCVYMWWASAVEASTGAACSLNPVPLVPDREHRIPLTLPDPADLCTRDSVITVRVHPYAGTDRSAVLAAHFAATAVPAEGTPETCSTALAESGIDDSRSGDDITDDTLLIRLPVLDRTPDQQACRYDVTLLPPAGFSTAPAGATAENVEADSSVDFQTSTGGSPKTILLAQNVTGAPDGASARFTLFSDCLPSVLASTPPGGGIRPTRMVELREGRYNLSAAFAAGPAALDPSGGAEVLVVSNQTGACEVTLSVSHLPERCTTESPVATASLSATARRAPLDIEIRCRPGS